MKIQKKHIVALFIVVAATVNAKASLALTCKPSPTQGEVNTTAPLQGGNIHVGPDTPNGTVIYNLYFKPFRAIVIDCDSSTTPYVPTISWGYASTPLPLSSWSGTPYGGKVYQTGVPGVGVAVRNSSNAFPYSNNPWTNLSTEAKSWLAQGGFEFDLVLIKIGNITPGVISGSNLPKVQIYFQTPFSPQISVTTVTYTGSLNITSSTCTTPDVSVPLGSYDVSKTFTAVGKTTPWVDASIKLTNCPIFYGTLNDVQKTYTGPGGSPAGVGPFIANTLSVKLTPQTTVWDTTKGIMNIASGSGSATGVGIQLAWGDRSSSPQPINWNLNYNYIPENTSGTTFNIPLSARYYQTNSIVTPGRADGKVTFTINYY